MIHDIPDAALCFGTDFISNGGGKVRHDQSEKENAKYKKFNHFLRPPVLIPLIFFHNKHGRGL
jgi:hypothetical protein